MGDGSRGARRRRLLLQSALDHFSSMGYAKSTTRSIAESTGCTEAVLFQYFATKRKLLEACLREGAPGDPLEGLQENPDTKSMPLHKATGAYIRAYLDCLWNHRKWFGIIIQEYGHDEGVREAAATYLRPAFEEFRAFLHRRAAEGEIPTDRIDGVSRMVADATQGFLHRVFNDPPEDFGRSRERFIKPILDGLPCAVDRN